LRVRIGTALRPHPEKVDRGGEDAACVRAAANVIAVADGVGGWADEGVDPALVRCVIWR
jgi:protein phosphatase PTC7